MALQLLRLCKPVLLAGCRAEASGELVMAPQRAITTSDVTRGGGGVEGGTGVQQDADFGAFLHRSVASLLRALYDRWSRRAFCSPEVRRPVSQTPLNQGDLGTDAVYMCTLAMWCRRGLWRAWRTGGCDGR